MAKATRGAVAALKASVAANEKVPASDREVTALHNAPMTEAEVTTLLLNLGTEMRAAEKSAAEAGAARKNSKAISMTEFTRLAELGAITAENFGSYFLIWRYGDKSHALERSHSSEQARFKRAVVAGITASKSGRSMVSLMNTVTATVEKLKADRKAKPAKERVNIPEPRQADLAIYQVIGEMNEKGRMLTEAELTAAIHKPPAVVDANPFATAIKSLLGSVNMLLDEDKAKKAGIALNDDETAMLRKTRASIEDIAAEIRRREKEVAEQEAEEQEAA